MAAYGLASPEMSEEWWLTVVASRVSTNPRRLSIRGGAVGKAM